MFSTYQLPFNFDADALRADLDQVLPEEWRPHFNRGYYEGEWKALALRSTTGQAKEIYRAPNDTREAIETIVLSRCVYFQKVLNAFECPILTARLMSLGPGSRILEHEDFFLGFEYGSIRIHIPITTDRRVEFFLAGERLQMKEGEAWYIDFGRPHRVNNLSDQNRVHLVIDCTVNEWLRALFPTGTIPQEAAEVQSQFVESSEAREVKE